MAGRQLSDRNEGSATLQPAGTRIPQRLIAAATAAVALLCYYATLLPGLDLGDSASFQTGVGHLTLTPRQAYPLYHALGNVFVWLHPGEPARALNLATAVFGALSVGVATALAAKLAESKLAGAASGLFLAFSYTYWSQAITAEVYTLHLLIVGTSALALLWWADQPGTGRLAAFYAIYALGFGNHLSMVLWLPAFTIFLLVNRRPGPGDPLRPWLIALAVAIAAAGALQYAWNFRGMWAELEPPASLVEAVGKFWFDVTKSDWRASIVGTVSEAGLESRPAMHWFDLQQQFGVPGIALGAIGAIAILVRWPSRGILLILAYAANLIFAWTYNVGDVYIFFMPSHYVLALCAGAGVAAIVRVVLRLSNNTIATTAGLICLLYPAWRGYDTFPAMDRSRDNRAVELLDRFTTQPAHRSAVFDMDANWQVQNAAEYFMGRYRPGIPWFVTEHLEWLETGNVDARVRTLVEDNRAIGREVIVGPAGLAKFESLGYAGGTDDVSDLEMTQDGQDLFNERIDSVAAGTPYALGILMPDPAYPLDRVALARAWTRLTGGSVELPPLRTYTIVLGKVGERPALVKSDDRPYRSSTQMGSFRFDVRMESWLPTDTIRRAGFGHVIVNRAHLLTLERGVSFAALPPPNPPSPYGGQTPVQYGGQTPVRGPGGVVAYLSGLFAPIPRYALGGR